MPPRKEPAPPDRCSITYPTATPIVHCIVRRPSGGDCLWKTVLAKRKFPAGLNGDGEIGAAYAACVGLAREFHRSPLRCDSGPPMTQFQGQAMVERITNEEKTCWQARVSSLLRSRTLTGSVYELTRALRRKSQRPDCCLIRGVTQIHEQHHGGAGRRRRWISRDNQRVCWLLLCQAPARNSATLAVAVRERAEKAPLLQAPVQAVTSLTGTVSHRIACNRSTP
jgi:hypothetical protein